MIDLFHPYRCISLATSTDRRALIILHFERAAIQVRFFDGVLVTRGDLAYVAAKEGVTLAEFAQN
jgi:hypothetical protein